MQEAVGHEVLVDCCKYIDTAYHTTKSAMEVYLRLNPDKLEDQTITEEDTELYKDNSITFHSNTGIGALHSLDKETFQFDKIFSPSTSQNDISSYLVPSLVKDLYDGINSSIITFGFKHTGKSFTLYGQQGLDLGVIPRLFTKLFHRKDDYIDKNHDITFKVSLLNVLHNDTITDVFNQGHNVSLQKDDIQGGYSAKNAKWLYCHTLQELLLLVGQVSNITQGHTILNLQIIQTLMSDNTTIKGTLTVVDLQNDNDDDSKEDNTLYDKFTAMIRDVTRRNDLKSNLNKLIYDVIFNNYKTRFLLTCSLLPICQGETLKTLELTKYLSGIVKYDIIKNISWIAPADKYEILSQQIQMKSENYEKQIELLNDTISLFESRTHNLRKREEETEILITDNLSLEATWQNLLKEIEPTDETLEIMLDKNSTLINERFQLADQVETNKFTHRERNNGQRIDTEFDIMNSTLLEFINKQETKVQSVLNENMACKEQIDQLQSQYSINNERIRLLENELTPFKQLELSHLSISSHGTNASSVLTEGSFTSSARNSGLFQSSMISPSSSSNKQRSPNKNRSREHSLSGFNLQIMKSK